MAKIWQSMLLVIKVSL